MSESIQSCQNFEADERAVEAAAQIGCVALESVDATYGSGYPFWTPGNNELSYHNGHHARAVGDGAAKVAEALGLSRRTVAIAKSSGYAHDENQFNGRGIDEAKSAAWMQLHMERSKAFTPLEQEMARLAIIGTEPVFDEDFNIIGQIATQLEYPTAEAEKASLSVACGDFGELYQPQGPFNSHQLYREIQKMQPADELSMDKLLNFQRSQIRLLDSYEYPLREANTLLATHKSEVLAYSTKVLDQLEHGDFMSWQELINQDTAFMQSLS